MTYVITQSCCNDASCVAVCPVNCIHPTPDEPGYHQAEMLYIDPGACIDCGVCAEVCPVDAILPDDALSGTTEPYRQINAEYFRRHPRVEKVAAGVPSPGAPGSALARHAREPAPLRVAIVGAGPSGFFTAEALLAQRDVPVEVTMIERLPFAGGLVRFGVAPDHGHTKRVERVFERVAHRDGLTFFLDVEVGHDISLDELLDHHHAVVYASGASGDRRLGIPGEDLPGSYSAHDLVAWYNGHPEYADRNFDLSSRRAVIIGNGNVALDVARLLLSDAESLRHTDIADHALEALASIAVDEVVVLGRRGPEFAACTTPELLALGSLPGIDVCVPSAIAADADAPAKLKVLAEYASRDRRPDTKCITMGFDTAPIELIGPWRINGLRVANTVTGKHAIIECGLVIRSIGYQGRPVPGLPFDETTCTVPNARGRVIDGCSEQAQPGRYVVGWLKRGPTGAIGTNRHCAAQTVDAILADYHAGLLAAPNSGAKALAALIRSRRPGALDARAWRMVDRYERAAGRRQGRPRVKVVERGEIASVVSNGSKGPVRAPGA
jgi:ferredoxin/flavodoxin---NADP+ reductase